MAGSDRRPLKVLTLVGGIYGGGETLARQIAMNLDRSRFESSFCLSRWEQQSVYERARQELDEAGVKFLGVGRKSRFELLPWASLVRHARRQRIDIFHTHLLGSNLWGGVLAPLAGVPVQVAHEHSWSFEGQRTRRFLDRQVARRADAVVAVSTEDRRKMHEVEGIPLERLRLVPNGIPTPPPPDPAVDLRAELGIEPDRPVVAVVATLRPEKALDVLIQAMVPLARRLPGVQLLLAGGIASLDAGGPDPARRELEALARRLGVGGQVRMLGYRTDVANVLAAADVGVLSSDSEGSPLAVMEYMAAGKPVVAPRVGGIPDLVEDGVTGILVERRDPEALAAGVAAVLGDPARAEKMGRAGRERRQRDFSIENTVRRVEELYEELYAARVRAR